jgi:hypothetical protein
MLAEIREVCMKVERYQPRKRNNLPVLACGMLTGLFIIAACGLILLVVVLPRLPDLAMHAAGFERAGDTGSIFDEPVADLPPLTNSTNLSETLVIQAGSYGQQPIDPVRSNLDVQIGSSSDGTQEVRLTINETDLIGLCQQISTICTTAGDLVRNVSFDLRPGGVVLYGDFFIEAAGIFQRAGIVLRINEFNQFTIAGVDINGSLYTAPPNELGALISEAERTANDILRQFVLQAGMNTYSLRSLYADDNLLTLLLR